MNHVMIEHLNNHPIVRVDDFELFDFLDDLFVDNGIEYEWMEEVRADEEVKYLMHFPSDTDVSKLEAVLNSLSKYEVNRIWEFNNK